ncbi:protein phosphatase 1 regulatory subunit 15A [Ictidomys tridecemlineatus]|uniref:protein phosphatase 1 regulatory subunit 15A n=1 Tax=Ictidomys tridecemlineatus TaxID=43179 RepID=UPI0006809790|nr:protein phosphatase 1 regulatory subunit 15A [Ictidomys tridecemlineatus]KAG3256459.1 protein phosphatase 1 regulatory subunit 15A [Ictidomys tridecemlineatus]
MAPGQVPHHSTPWREAHYSYLLSPLMGFLSRAWSRLRGPGPSEPWLVEAVTGENLVEGGLQGEVKASLAISHGPWARPPQGEAEDSGVPQENGEADLESCLDLKPSNSPPEAWGLLGSEENSEKDASSVPREQGIEITDGQPLSHSLQIRALQGSDKSPGEEKAEEEGVTKFSYPSSHWEWSDVKKEAPAASTFPESSGSQLGTCVYCPEEKENQATEEKGTENEARKTSVSPSLAGSSSRAWGYCPGERPREKGRKACGAPGKEADPEPWSSVPAQRHLLGALENQPSKNGKEEEDDSALGATEKGGAKGPSSISSTSASGRVWVCQPGENAEDQKSDLGSAEEEGESEASSPTLPTSALLKAWVYRPDCGAAAWGQHPSLQAQSAHLRGWLYQPGKETEEEEAEGKWGDSETSPFRVAFYLPGEKPPPPWTAPKLPLRLQRRLRLSQTLTQDPDPETPPKSRKVRFSEKVTVHFLAVWAGPAQAARRGPWEQFARDRSRFARRIAQAQEKLGPCLTPASRARAWARLGNAPSSLTPLPASTQTLFFPLISSEAPAQATPLSQAMATPPHTPSLEAPALSLNLTGRRG